MSICIPLTTMKQTQSHFCVSIFFLMAFLQDTQTEDLCDCSCEYRAKIDDAAAQMVVWNEKTEEEKMEILQPELDKMKNELLVNLSDISANKMKKISASDDRKSSQYLGYLGILFISLVLGGLLMMDIAGIPQYVGLLRHNLNCE